MRRAIAVAAPYRPHPNPRVGALLVTPDGTVIAEGAHVAAGTDHAERVVLDSVDEIPPDAALIVTLEPCTHQGRTPPCAQFIVERGVRRVVVGALDPDSRVAGRGIETLRRAGIAVEVEVE
ncbi:MAG: riboflavin biosynthesis protein RibD, partial [Acidimicrobiia bacterium]|nr:riboflavin biosynthesis protein RibD [Acidimicrobiia bacterium]